MKFSSLLAILSIFCLISTSFAQEDATVNAQNEETAPVVEIVTASPDVHITAVFPDSPVEKKLYTGEIGELVFSFTNTGDKTFNVTYAHGSLRYPIDWKYTIQNFTKIGYAVTVAPGEQHTFLYQFRPDALIEPREFGFQAQVFYTDLENVNYTSVIYNNTVALEEKIEGFDFQMLFTYVGILAVAFLVAFFVYNSITKSSKKKAPRRAVVETGTSKKSDAVDNEWLAGTSADKRFQKTAQVKSPKQSKKSQ